ncbi:MAG: hypothetical protein LBD30_02705 [Verrucomicrobiales bacterium]|jgi:hypothetical protein|nr:hypothetical protein [Verrucomicrobiales bacterium]
MNINCIVNSNQPKLKNHAAWKNLPLILALTAVALHSADAEVPAEVSVSGSTLTVTSEETVSGDTFQDSGNSNHYNAVVVENSGSLVLGAGGKIMVQNNSDKTAFFRVGYGSGGFLDIGSGASLNVGQSSRYANFHVGDGGGGTVRQSGGTVLVLGSLNVGVGGGAGVYRIDGGTLTLDHADDAGHTSLATLGFNNSSATASSGELWIGGGTVSVTAHEYSAGNYGSTQLILGNRVDGYGGDGVINQSDGVLKVDNHATLWLSSAGSGTYNLSGGALQIGGESLQGNYQNKGGQYAFNLGSGTIQVTGGDLRASVNANLDAAAVSTIDTNGQNATWSGNLTATGAQQVEQGGNALLKTGAGTLTLTGSNRLDTFAALAGVTSQTAGKTSALEFMVGSGNGSAGAYLLDGGTLTVTPSAEKAGSFRIGDFGGSGALTQTGGRLELAANSSFNVGNQGGSGVVNLSGGEIILDEGLHVIGRSAAGRAASQGEVNVSGGVFQVQNGGKLILGNNQKTDASSATFTQSGGVVRVDSNSALYLSASTGGTYNLHGGALEIGGDSLQARYNNNSSAYAFNLGGGTLRVIGSDLVTTVTATLQNAASSVIDTNNLNATFSGAINGSGGDLRKIGGGRLTIESLPADNGTLTVEEGALTLSGAVGLATSIVSGAVLTVDRGVNFSAGLSTDAGAVLEFVLGNGGDNFIIGDNVSISAGTVFQLLAGGLDLGIDHTWTLITENGGPLSITANDISVSGLDAGQVSLSVSGNNLLLQYQAVPEPSALMLMLCGAAVAVVWLGIKRSA